MNSNIPPVIFGTSGLGNLYVARNERDKLNIVLECVHQANDTVVFDTAGKYGAGLALETLGKCLKQLKVNPDKVIISNKLGWLRTGLKTQEPTFEPGVWKDLKYDAVQKIGYDGILECFEQGNELLNGYTPKMVSVHDPDEYLAKAMDRQHELELYEDILDAYEALFDLKSKGKVESIGVGAKDWNIIQRIASDVKLDWVMFANSLTIKKHPIALLRFTQELEKKGVFIINSAVFHSGFLVGSDYFDYSLVTPATHPDLFEWRKKFFTICNRYNIKPATACVQFAINIQGVKSIALNTTDANRIKQNIEMAHAQIPASFWDELKETGLITYNFRNQQREDTNLYRTTNP